MTLRFLPILKKAELAYAMRSAWLHLALTAILTLGITIWSRECHGSVTGGGDGLVTGRREKTETFSVAEAACQVVEVFNAAIAEEGPPATHVLAATQVHFHHCHLFFVLLSAEEKFSLRSGDETASPELNAASLSAWVFFVTGAIDGNHG